MNKITTRVAEFSYNKESKILRIKYVDGVEIETDDVIQNYEVTKELTGGDKYLALIEGRVDIAFSKEIKHLVSEIKDEDKIAEAYVIKSAKNKILGNFYINFNRPKIATKIFFTEEQAIEWLGEFLYLTESGLLNQIHLN